MDILYEVGDEFLTNEFYTSFGIQFHAQIISIESNGKITVKYSDGIINNFTRTHQSYQIRHMIRCGEWVSNCESVCPELSGVL